MAIGMEDTNFKKKIRTKVEIIFRKAAYLYEICVLCWTIFSFSAFA
jgi:hypothetical protein